MFSNIGYQYFNNCMFFVIMLAFMFTALMDTLENSSKIMPNTLVFVQSTRQKHGMMVSIQVLIN